MKTLKITLALVAFSFATNAVVAQEKKTISDEKKTEMKEQFQMNKEKLSLTPEQEEKFKSINQKFGEKIKDVKKSDLSRKEKLGQVKEIREQKNAEMKTILSESQYKIYLEIQEERIEKMKEHRKERKEGL